MSNPWTGVPREKAQKERDTIMNDINSSINRFLETVTSVTTEPVPVVTFADCVQIDDSEDVERPAWVAPLLDALAVAAAIGIAVIGYLVLSH